MLSTSTSFDAAFNKKGTQPVWYVVMSYQKTTEYLKFLSAPVSPSSDLYGYPISIIGMSNFGDELDLMTREKKSCEYYIDFDKNAVREVYLNYLKAYKGAIWVYLGAYDLSLADFELVFSGKINEISMTSDGNYHFVAQDRIFQLKEVKAAAIYYGMHPLEIMFNNETTFPGGIFTRAGLNADSDSFNPLNEDYDSSGMQHLVVGTGDNLTGYKTAYDFTKDLVLGLYGHLKLVDDEITFKLFNPAATAEVYWTSDVIIKDSFEQDFDKRMYNQIYYHIHGNGNGGYHNGFYLGCTASQTAFLDYDPLLSSKSGISLIKYDWPWNDTVMHLSSSSTTIGTGTTDFYICPTTNMSGNRDEVDSAYRVSASQPLYLLHCVPNLPSEIIKVTAITRNTYTDCTYTYYDPQYEYFWHQSVESTVARITSCTRGYSGTIAIAGTKETSVFYDITAPFMCAEKILKRFSYGCPVVSFKTLISEIKYEVGDIVSFEYDDFFWYNINGMDDSYTWEIIEKEINFYDEEPHIKWKLALASKVETPTLKGFGFRFDDVVRLKDTNGSIFGEIYGEKTFQGIVKVGFGIAQKSGLTGTISTGTAGFPNNTNVTLPEDTDYDFTASKDTYVYVDAVTGSLNYYAVANGAAAPTVDKNYIFLAKVVTDGTDITSVVTTGKPTKSILGAQLVDLSVAEAAIGLDAVTATKIKAGEVKNSHISAVADDRIVGSKLLEGSGPLTYLSSAGALDNITHVTSRSLDNITDGDTYKRVTGVSSGQVQAASVATSAISAVHINDDDVRDSLNKNAAMLHWTRG